GVVIGAAQRLEDRALARLRACRALQDDGGLGVVARSDEGLAALEQRVGALALGVGEIWLAGLRHQGMVAFIMRPGDQADRQSWSLPRWRRGESVRPGIRPRLAIGLPSISLMSPVKSIGVAPLMYEPTAYESTGAPASRKTPMRSGFSPPETTIF